MYKKILFKHESFEEEAVESVWGIERENGFQIDNILFYAKEYSFGDIVKVEEVKGELFVVGLVQESGHSTIRVLFHDLSQVQIVREKLKSMGCSSELSNIPSLISVDIPKEISIKKVLKFLDQGEYLGVWEYEEACISSVHNVE